MQHGFRFFFHQTHSKCYERKYLFETILRNWCVICMVRLLMGLLGRFYSDYLINRQRLLWLFDYLIMLFTKITNDYVIIWQYIFVVMRLLGNPHEWPLWYCNLFQYKSLMYLYTWLYNSNDICTKYFFPLSIL